MITPEPVSMMRTTLDIDDDVLLAIKDRARRERKTAGEVLSGLARQALTTAPQSHAFGTHEPSPFYGFEPLPAEPNLIITNERINQLREDAGV